MDARYFFNSRPYLLQQGEPKILELSRGISSARFAWFKQNNEGYSPLKAPFGSIEIQGPYSNSLVHELLEELIGNLQKEKVSALSITMPPDGYDFETGFLLAKALQSHGFQLGFQDLNFHLEVKSEFKKHLHRSERWKLNKSIRAGYSFQKNDKPDWDLVFNLLNESRERKGFRLSMDQESLEKAFNFFPERYQLFEVIKDNETVAVAITLKINKDILYVFYTADLLKHRKLSPVVLLHNGIYQYCQFERIQLLDLGTSSLKGLVNSGVANFKRNLGGIASLKNTFVKRI